MFVAFTARWLSTALILAQERAESAPYCHGLEVGRQHNVKGVTELLQVEVNFVPVLSWEALQRLNCLEHFTRQQEEGPDLNPLGVQVSHWGESPYFNS
jgi:hypothetical protein